MVNVSSQELRNGLCSRITLDRLLRDRWSMYGLFPALGCHLDLNIETVNGLPCTQNLCLEWTNNINNYNVTYEGLNQNSSF